MENYYLKGAVEAVLFASGEAVAADRIAEAVGADLELVLEALDAIAYDLDRRDSGMCLLQLEDRYQLTTRNTYSEQVRNILDNRKNTPLSQAAMEVLAIIAYNQPVSRPFIDQVRGVDSSSSVASLMARGLIAEAGRLDLPGRPVSFKTTDVFLRSFGFSSLADMPTIVTDDDRAETLDTLTETFADDEE